MNWIAAIAITGLLCLQPCLCRAKDQADVRKLETILGSATNVWRISPADYHVADQEGKPVLIGGGSPTVLTGLNKLEADSEV